MSRVGRQPIEIPTGIKANVKDGVFTAEGPKGKVSQVLLEGIPVEIKDSQVLVTRSAETGDLRAKHGLVRSLLANAVHGVSEGFSKKLEIHGVGYRAELKGKDLHLALGFSHPVVYKGREGVDLNVDTKANTVEVSGADRQQVGQVAAEIRSLKKPEPYKGKGIRYSGRVGSPQGRQGRRHQVARGVEMDRAKVKREKRQRAHLRIRKRVSGTTERPRLTVFRSQKYVYAQVINDLTGQTLAQANSAEKGFLDEVEGSGKSRAAAKKVGETVCERAKEKGIERVVFDRGGYIYHGRVKQVAEGARSKGLEF